ncbi:hypothetical protein ACS0TY_015544 [Phlomoides rotata]
MASLFVLSLTLILAFLCNCEADLISDVCSKSKNPSLCIQTLTSDSHSSGADVVGLGQIAVKIAEATTRDTIRVVKSFGRDKDIVDTCVDTTDENIRKYLRYIFDIFIFRDHQYRYQGERYFHTIHKNVDKYRYGISILITFLYKLSLISRKYRGNIEKCRENIEKI